MTHLYAVFIFISRSGYMLHGYPFSQSAKAAIYCLLIYVDVRKGKRGNPFCNFAQKNLLNFVAGSLRKGQCASLCYPVITGQNALWYHPRPNNWLPRSGRARHKSSQMDFMKPRTQARAAVRSSAAHREDCSEGVRGTAGKFAALRCSAFCCVLIYVDVRESEKGNRPRPFLYIH